MSLTTKRKLDFFIAVYNRQNYLFDFLRSALVADVLGANFVVFDDASDGSEDVPGLGVVTVEQVCHSFNDERIIYVRNPTNIGFANSLDRYYQEFCQAEYAALANPKDEFIDGAPLRDALRKLDQDHKISLIVFPIRQSDRFEPDRLHQFRYDRMIGREFIARYVADPTLQHCSSYAIMRVSAVRDAGCPRNMNLRELGLEDGSGIDHDLIFNTAATGDVDFVDRPPIRRRIVGGYTEQFPLTFAYTQYRYAVRLMAELYPRGVVSAETRHTYLTFWHRQIARGLFIVFHGGIGCVERGTSRIGPALPMPIWFYLPYECLRLKILPRRETPYQYIRAFIYMVIGPFRQRSPLSSLQ